MIQNIPYCTNFTMQMINNKNTLNIFSDASMRKRGNILDSCYGSVAVCQDDIVDELFRINSECTVPAGEIRGIRCSLSLADKWKYMFKNINIFSDSQIALFGLRDYIYNWKYNPADNMFYNGRNKLNLVKNQELYLECFQLLNILKQTNIVNLYHQCGHVDNGKDNLINAIEVFKKSNNIHGKVDYNTIRYISIYNNYVDSKSRSFIRRTNTYENIYYDPVSFYPQSDLPKSINIIKQ